MVSLIIPTFNREQPLINCLQCAEAQDFEQLEIIVIDQTNSHSPQTLRFFETLSSKVRIIRHSPPSAVTARNVGLCEARGEILIFIDDDTTFESDFVTAHVCAHSNGVDTVQGRVVEHGRGVSYRAQWMLPWLRVVGSNTYDKPGIVNTLTGCNFSVSRKLVDKVGEFDVKFSGVLIREDADYGARCHKGKFKMVFEPKAAVIHHLHPSGGVDSNLRQAMRIFEPSVLRNELYFARKHFHPIIVWQYKLRLMRRLRLAIEKSGQAPKKSPRILIKKADQEARKLIH